MKKLIVLLISITLFSCNKVDDNYSPEIEVEKIYEGYVNLLSQEEVYEFSSSGYTKIIGGLIIGPYNENQTDSTIKELLGLSKLNSIEGYLSITNNLSLSSLDGLANIEELKSFDGLNGIFHVRNNVKIHNCAIENLSGLEKLSWVDGNIKIKYNFNLRNIDALVNVKAHNADNININNNPVLNDFCGLIPLLNDFNGDLIIVANAYNPSIEDIIDGNCSQ